MRGEITLGANLIRKLKGSYVITKDNNIVQASDEFTNLTGYASGDFIGKSLYEFSVILRLSLDISKNYNNTNDSCYLFTKGYEAREVYIICEELFCENKKIYYIEEKENSRLENKFPYIEKMCEDNVNGVSILSVPDLILLKTNQKTLDFLGEPFNKKENSIGKKQRIIIPRLNNIEVEEFYENIIKNGITYYGKEVKVYNHEKGETYLGTTVVPIYENGAIKYLINTFLDVTERVQYEKAIKKQRDKMHKIFGMIDCAITRLSYPDFKIIGQNKRSYNYFKKNFGVNIKIGKAFMDFLPKFNTGESRECIQEMIKSKSTASLVEKVTCLNGEQKYFKIIYEPILGINNEMSEVIIIAIDVTKEMIEKNQIEGVMKAQGEFFSFIAHEFRTPLTTISSTLQLLDLVYSEEMTGNIKKYMHTIRRSTYQQLRLVNNLLDITRAEAGYLKVHNKNYDIVAMTKSIIDSISIYAKSNDIKILFHSEFEKKIVGLDDEKYERILLNLLSNSIKFTPKGKSIGIVISSHNNKVCIKLKDEGVGIPKNKQREVFQRFGQTGSNITKSGEGTGIGLYLVKLLVDAMNGKIVLESEENKGSTFIITIPDNVVCEDEDSKLLEVTNNRYVKNMQIEFSNIYLE